MIRRVFNSNLMLTAKNYQNRYKLLVHSIIGNTNVPSNMINSLVNGKLLLIFLEVIICKFLIYFFQLKFEPNFYKLLVINTLLMMNGFVVMTMQRIQIFTDILIIPF